MTPLGQLPFFIDFLKASGRFDGLVADCPRVRMRRESAIYSEGRCCRCFLATDVTLISLRYGATAFCPSCSSKIVSEDAVRRASVPGRPGFCRRRSVGRTP
jgi:hypothetical protein